MAFFPGIVSRGSWPLNMACLVAVSLGLFKDDLAFLPVLALPAVFLLLSAEKGCGPERERCKREVLQETGGSAPYQ